MKIFAHRGFSYKFPEATRAAYKSAIDVGADGLECDVRLTKDRIPICIHDRNTKRLAGINRSVSRSNFNELRQVTELLTLEELLKLAKDSRREILIETKHPVRSGGRVEEVVIDLLKQYQVKAIAMSFSLLAVLRFKRELNDVAYVVSRRWRLIWIPTKKVAIDVDLFAKSRWTRKRLRNRQVLLWTVNEKRLIPKLIKWDVYGVITDRPDLPFRLS